MKAMENGSKHMENAKFIGLHAGVRYWEDGILNGERDDDGAVPFRKENYWEPVIDLDDGTVIGWPAGVTLQAHYKVCDDGEYWLMDHRMTRIAHHESDYVPDMLAIGKHGYGDYIILSIGPDGKISDWGRPKIDVSEWVKE